MSLSPELTQKLEGFLSELKGLPVNIQNTLPITGGCIHRSVALVTDQGYWFLKSNNKSQLDNFQCEEKGLKLLKGAASLKVPEPLLAAEVGEDAFLLMEHIASGHREVSFWEDFGNGLAELHQNTAKSFGLDHDNYIGSLPQSNTQHQNWAGFFRAERLKPQIKLAKENGYLDPETEKAFENLFGKLEELMPGCQPALLHGDLWSGNFMVSAEGGPVIIDPAVYYGHPEAEMAFTTLFGGFSHYFYNAYEAASGIDKDWRDRIDLFNLYPLMVHLNLFGRGYLPQIQSILHHYIK